jgi:two-component system response regulator NreC
VRILIVDDHGVVRRGLRWLIEKQPGWVVVGEAISGTEGVALAADLRPDVTCLDLSMPGGSGLDVIRQLSEVTHVLVLTASDDEFYACQSFARGALGYLTKDGSEADYVSALTSVAAGRRYVSRRLSAASLGSSIAPTILSKREVAELRLVALGYTNKEIAVRLGVSVKTVETYKARIQEKLSVFSRAEMVHYAIEHGLVDHDTD